MSLADRGLLWALPLSQAVYPIAEVILIPALIAWIVCPLGVLVVACHSVQTPRVFAAILAEAVLFLAQFVVLLPTVQ